MRNKYVRNRVAVVKNLLRLSELVPVYIDDELSNLALDAVEVAKDTLMEVALDEDFTQKFGTSLVNEIGAKKTRNGIAIVTPYLHFEKDTAQNMYYAEYGAGILAEGGDGQKDKTKAYEWKYHTTYLDSARTVYVDEKSRVIGSRQPPYKYYLKTKGWVGVTDRSKPAHYMEAARRYLRKNWKPHFQKAVNTVIYRTFREKTTYPKSDENKESKE